MSTPANETTQSKSWVISRQFAGALMGIFIFLLLLILVKILDGYSIIFTFIDLDLELLGRITVGTLSVFAKIDLPENLYNSLSTVMSSIPPGILGWLISSNERAIKVAGAVLLGVYICFLVVIGTLLTLMAI